MSATPESRLQESQWVEQLSRLRGSRWMGWRLRLLVSVALIGSIALFLLARWLGNTPGLDATWRSDAHGRVELQASSSPLLAPHVGRTLVAVGHVTEDVSPVAVDALTLRRSSRWMLDGDERRRHRALHTQLAEVLEHDAVTLHFLDGGSVRAPVVPRGTAELGAVFWMVGGFALMLYLVAMVVVLARPTLANLLYAVMSLAQAGNLVFIAIESTLLLGLPPPIPGLDMPLRMAFDLITAAAIVTAVTLYPVRLPHAGRIALAAWVVAGICALIPVLHLPGEGWWPMQIGVLTLGAVALGLLSWSLHLNHHPFTRLMRRFGVIIVGTLVLLIGTLETIRRSTPLPFDVASAGSMIWYVLFASFQLLLPFLSKSQQVMREFSLLAAVSTVATSLDLLFVAFFSFGQFTSLALSLFLSLGVYAGARQWVLNRLLGQTVRTTERMFEQLYRMAREVESRPDRTGELLSGLLHDVFEPLELLLVDRPTDKSRILSAGAVLVVPMPRLGVDAEEAIQPAQSISIYHADRGRRLFTWEDARLADRILQQLRRAIAFDKAVEQGRSEERTRIAQDLHDDIGARLLTLMYKAANPEIEEYVRHTLKDLKTLTRGLAASNHRLSHAAAEWKADLSQRLAVARIMLGWHFLFDEDVRLTVVQWSALTRVLRELISNTIAHSQARRVDIFFELQGGKVDFTITDDGTGRDPSTWSHGLGLGGVRKRIKQLGGEVEWTEARPAGITCRIRLPKLVTPR